MLKQDLAPLNEQGGSAVIHPKVSKLDVSLRSDDADIPDVYLEPVEGNGRPRDLHTDHRWIGLGDDPGGIGQPVALITLDFCSSKTAVEVQRRGDLEREIGGEIGPFGDPEFIAGLGGVEGRVEAGEGVVPGGAGSSAGSGSINVVNLLGGEWRGRTEQEEHEETDTHRATGGG